MSEFYKMAVTNIAKKGDTDIFPFPVEKYLFFDKPDEIVDILMDMDRNYDKSYKSVPISTIKTCIPVGYTGFRWATMIDPVWNAFFLGEVLKISGQIEKKRIPVEEKSVFSYRMKYDEESGTLFDHEVNWKAFYESAREKAKNHDYVITFDISDFYNRIYHENLKEVLHTDADADGNSVNRIMDIVSRISTGNEPYGLPVGGNAARILAEALLIRTDNFMRNNGIVFCRFVDDFILFAKSQEKAYTILNTCAEYFLRTFGLSLQKNKTAIMTKAEFISHVRSVFSEIESDKDPAKKTILNLRLHVDPYSQTADEDLRALREKIDGLQLIRLLKSECRKTKINQMFGKQLISAVQFLEKEDQSKAFEILSINFEKLYPVFPVIMRKAYDNLLNCGKDTIELFIGKICTLVDDNSYIIQSENNASYAIRVLSRFKSEMSEQAIIKLYERTADGNGNSSDLVKMNAVYAMANLRSSEWLMEKLKAFPQRSLWVRRSVIASAPFLGAEGKNLREQYRKFCSAEENLIGDWVSEKLSDKQNWDLPL
jgi:hypothetical protein